MIWEAARVRCATHLIVSVNSTPSANRRRVVLVLMDYLTAADSLQALKTDTLPWTRHDWVERPGEVLISDCFVGNLKKYAKGAGVEGFHLHRTCHTFARIASEVNGDIAATRSALDPTTV